VRRVPDYDRVTGLVIRSRLALRFPKPHRHVLFASSDGQRRFFGRRPTRIRDERSFRMPHLRVRRAPSHWSKLRTPNEPQCFDENTAAISSQALAALLALLKIAAAKQGRWVRADAAERFASALKQTLLLAGQSAAMGHFRTLTVRTSGTSVSRPDLGTGDHYQNVGAFLAQ
jgi:hypothetical protein